MSRLTPTERQACLELDALYAELPSIACTGRCAIACGPIVLTPLEARRLQVTTHRKPRTLPMTAVDAAGNPMRQRCVYLHDDRCTAYAVRPLICRAWGVVKQLSCMHGCVPDRWLTEVELVAVGQAIERLGGLLVQTAVDGLTRSPGDTWFGLVPRRSLDAIAVDAERTRSLRALHGGRIVAVVDRGQ
jgi:Fe-S-cluster containining protein